MIYNVQLKEQRKTAGYKGVLFHVAVQLQREISILLIQAIAGDPTKLAKRCTVMLGEQGPKMVVVAKGGDPRKRSSPDETRYCRRSDTPEVITVCGFRLADRFSKDA